MLWRDLHSWPTVSFAFRHTRQVRVIFGFGSAGLVATAATQNVVDVSVAVVACLVLGLVLASGLDRWRKLVAATRARAVGERRSPFVTASMSGRGKELMEYAVMASCRPGDSLPGGLQIANQIADSDSVAGPLQISQHSSSDVAGNLSPQRDQIVVIGRGISTEGRQSVPAAFDPGAIAGASPAKHDVDLASEKENEAGFARPFAPETPLTGAACTVKRIFDVVVASAAIVLLLPMLIIAAIAVAIDSPGPIFFLQWRGGVNGKRFRIVKFRTMTCMEDGVEVCQARPFDARVTRVGRILRESSIDEIPQLFNVLRGDMSIVGPRPHAVVHDALYSRVIVNYAARQSVKPGITGWAQVNGCRGETREVAAMERRVQRDLEYIQRWSLLFDLKILAMTVSELLQSKNTY